MSAYTTYKQLLVTFGGQYTFNSKSTWAPSNSFDMIHINGNGSSITIKSDCNDEYRGVHLENTKCIFKSPFCPVCNTLLSVRYFYHGI